MDSRQSDAPNVPITQETVDRLLKAATMDEYLKIAKECGVDWDALPDEWLSAIASGDVTELIFQAERKARLMRKQQRKGQHADGI